MIVDSHVHINSEDAVRYRPVHEGGNRQGEKSGESHRGSLTAEGMLAMMDEAGIALGRSCPMRTVIVHGAHLLGFDNSYSADSARAHPQRFASVCVLDALADGAPDTLEYWIRERGMNGTRLFDATSDGYPPLDDARSIGLIQRARKLSIPVTLVMYHARIPEVRKVFERFPDVAFVIDHLARFPVVEKPPFDNSGDFFKLAELPNVSLKYSTVNQWAIRKGAQPERDYFKAIVDRFGPQRLMWGSNQPVTRYKPYAEAVRMGAEPLDFLRKDEVAAIMGGNAMRRFWN